MAALLRRGGCLIVLPQLQTGYIPFWVGFTTYGRFVILDEVDIARRSVCATRHGEQHDSRRSS
jgi:hypothetical protein